MGDIPSTFADFVLSDRQFTALHNLARKQAGEDVGWINIADARAVEQLGLAERTGEGWQITPEGAAALAAGPGRTRRAQESAIVSLPEGHLP
jgi:hypothetical protein